MLVEIVSLRHEGTKLTLGEVKAARPWLCEMIVERRAGGEVVATTDCPWVDRGHGSPTHQLRNARLLSLRDGQFVLAGEEDIGKAWAAQWVPQAWWCRLPAGWDTARPQPQVYVPLPIPIPERWQVKG